jgi:hypothetical protein
MGPCCGARAAATLFLPLMALDVLFMKGDTTLLLLSLPAALPDDVPAVAADADASPRSTSLVRFCKSVASVIYK